MTLKEFRGLNMERINEKVNDFVKELYRFVLETIKESQERIYHQVMLTTRF